MSQINCQSTQILSEIFADVGMSFTLMGELEMMLNPEYTSRNNISETDVLALRAAITKFGEDINAICKIIKKRTILQIKGSMKRLAYEEAGLPLRKQQIIAVPKATVSQEKIVRNVSNVSVLSQQSAKSADITLNMLNATEPEVDVEGLATADKLDYGCTDGS